MKKKDVRIGMIVAMKVSGKVVPVKIANIRTVFTPLDQITGRDCRAHSASKFRHEIKPKTELVHKTETPFRSMKLNAADRLTACRSRRMLTVGCNPEHERGRPRDAGSGR